MTVQITEFQLLVEQAPVLTTKQNGDLLPGLRVINQSCSAVLGILYRPWNTSLASAGANNKLSVSHRLGHGFDHRSLFQDVNPRGGPPRGLGRGVLERLY